MGKVMEVKDVSQREVRGKTAAAAGVVSCLLGHLGANSLYFSVCAL